MVLSSKEKGLIAISLLTVSLFLISARQQQLSVSVICLLLILSLLIQYNSFPLFICASLMVVFWLPASHWGQIYGRDSLFTAVQIRPLLFQGWSKGITDTYSGLSTPGFQMLAAISHLITDLPYYPKVETQVMVTSILPIALTIVLMICVYAIVNTSIKGGHPGVYAIPVLMWFPAIIFHIGFRKETMGILMFSLLVLVYLRGGQDRNAWMILFSIFSISVVSSHHLSSFISMIAIFCFWVGSIKEKRSSPSTIFLVLIVAIFLSWQIISGFGGRFSVYVFATFRLSAFDNLLGLLGTQADDTTIPRSISRSFTTIVVTYLIKYVYVALLGLGVSLLVIKNRNKESIPHMLFGASVAAMSFASLVGSIPVDFTRILSFFVIGSGWYGLYGIASITAKRNSSRSILYVSIGILIVFGLILVPAYSVSPQEPVYSEGETNQFFSSYQFGMSNFIGISNAENIVASANIAEVIETSTSATVRTRPYAVLTGTVPDQELVVLSEYNNRLYSGKYQGEWVNIKPIISKYKTSDKVYSSGRYQIYS